jgi:flagellar basal-body rod protein FlgF
MQSSLYVGLSAQVSLQQRLDTIANNVANTATAGFRSEEVKFEALLSRTPAEPVAFAGIGDTYISRRAGELVKTDNLLDIAAQGEAWFAINTPAGQVYTRDGRMQMSRTGELQNLNGHAMLDVGGAPIQLDAEAGPPQIARDGTITQNGRQVGAVGLFTIPEQAMLERYEGSGVIPDTPATAVVDFTKAGVAQGFVERSNVNPVMEMTRLIGVSRAFEAISAAITDSENALRDAIKTLGASG